MISILLARQLAVLFLIMGCGFLLALLAAVLIHVILFFLCWILGKFLEFNSVEKASLIYSNAGNLIIPLVTSVLGEMGNLCQCLSLCPDRCPLDPWPVSHERKQRNQLEKNPYQYQSVRHCSRDFAVFYPASSAFCIDRYHRYLILYNRIYKYASPGNAPGGSSLERSFHRKADLSDSFLENGGISGSRTAVSPLSQPRGSHGPRTDDSAHQPSGSDHSLSYHYYSDGPALRQSCPICQRY